MTTWRTASFRLGAMRQRITVQTPTFTVDTAGQSIPTWADTFAQEPAMFQSTNGAEVLLGKQVDAGIDAIFTVHYRDGYTVQQRIVYDSNNYGIVYVRPVEGGLRYLEIYCKAS